VDVTKSTYDASAAELAEFFAGFGSRKEEIDRACDTVQTGASSLTVLELGCGDGRDAGDILVRAGDYIGIDYSRELIALAKAKHPDYAEAFQVANMKDFAVKPAEYDVIFAFASFLHLSREELGVLLRRYCEALKEGGVMCMDFKYADNYERRQQVDRFGERIFYYYHPNEVIAMLPDEMREVNRRLFQKGSTKWFGLTVRKGVSNND
jgi:SAM-dependent methyltransferase